LFSNINTKFQQIGLTTDALNNDDWFYFPMSGTNTVRGQMQQYFVQGSFEGCLVQIYYYEEASVWYANRQVFAVDPIVSSTTFAQKTEFNLKKELSIAITDESIIPCSHEALYWHPYQEVFFYYWKNTKIVVLDRGFTTPGANDACNIAITPTAFTFTTVSPTNVDYISPPAFMNGYAYIAMDSTADTKSYIYRWDMAVATDGTVTNSAVFTLIFTGTASNQIRQLYGMLDVGLFWIYSGQVGYYIVKVDSSTGVYASDAQYQSTKSWNVYQAPYNSQEDVRPVYLTDQSAPGVIYKATNVLTQLFSEPDSPVRYDFFTYPTRFGRYYVMQVRPGTCAEERLGTENYNNLHVNILSLRDKAHSYCIDDSEDIYCGNSKWEAYNKEECDDGNIISGEGCDSECYVEPLYTCTQVENMTSVCSYVACGNSYLDTSEQCDDGNIISGDGCSSTCQIEDCYYCTPASSIATAVDASNCTLQCENGVIESTNPLVKTYLSGIAIIEVCDEGTGKADNLGCINCCSEVQLGYKCIGQGNECYLRCGDGIREDSEGPTLALPNNWDEHCDDGNNDSGDGCQADCLLAEAGYECPEPGGACNLICGNGVLDNPWVVASTDLWLGTYSDEA
jgi:cysteine-rich repeat protein